MPAPIAYAISVLHDALLWDAIVAAVALHVFAIVLYAVVKGHNLLRPMLTGRKTVPVDVGEPRRAPPTLALLLLIVAAAAVTALAKYM